MKNATPPPLDEARAHAEARAVAGDLEARVLRRAARLEAASGWREAILRWQGRARLVLVLAFALAFVFGFGAASDAELEHALSLTATIAASHGA
ncbi:MAG TPA: hypothetical protein PLO71_15195, partial [Thauera phenylacetica]|nr:hypothetical protein [Thauera phenylacetica]